MAEVQTYNVMMIMTMTAVIVTAFIIVVTATITNYLENFPFVHSSYSDNIFSTGVLICP